MTCGTARVAVGSLATVEVAAGVTSVVVAVADGVEADACMGCEALIRLVGAAVACSCSSAAVASEHQHNYTTSG